VVVTSVSEIVCGSFKGWEKKVKVMMRVSSDAVKKVQFKFIDKLGESRFEGRVVIKPSL